MKKILTLLLLFFCLKVSATTHFIRVSNFQFSPSNLNVVVGDIIRWEWVSGFHNSAALNIPSGADSWASPYLTTTGDFYEYTVNIEG
jgi:plastocyanin